jgi:hypothetical protein
MNAPEAGGCDQDERGHIVTQPLYQPGGDGSAERVSDQREVVYVERRQDGLHVLDVGGDAVAWRKVGVAEPGQVNRVAGTVDSRCQALPASGAVQQAVQQHQRGAIPGPELHAYPPDVRPGNRHGRGHAVDPRRRGDRHGIDRSGESGALLRGTMGGLLPPALRCDRLVNTMNAGRGLEPEHPRAEI